MSTLPQPTPSWAIPIAVGALATFLLHSVTLLIPGVWLVTCCTCGVSGVPVGFLSAFLAKRQDPMLGPVQGFAVSFIGTGVGVLALAFLVMVVQGWDVPPDFLEQVREYIEELNRQAPASEQQTPEEIAEFVELAGQIYQFMPLISSGFIIVTGGMTGLITASMMGRRGPPPPPA